MNEWLKKHRSPLDPVLVLFISLCLPNIKSFFALLSHSFSISFFLFLVIICCFLILFLFLCTCCLQKQNVFSQLNNCFRIVFANNRRNFRLLFRRKMNPLASIATQVPSYCTCFDATYSETVFSCKKSITLS